MKNIWMIILFGIIRTILAGLTGFLIQRGIIKPEDSELLIIAVGTGSVAIASSVWNKLKMNQRIRIALSMPEGTTMHQLEKVVNDTAITATIPETKKEESHAGSNRK